MSFSSYVSPFTGCATRDIIGISPLKNHLMHDEGIKEPSCMCQFTLNLKKLNYMERLPITWTIISISAIKSSKKRLELPQIRSTASRARPIRLTSLVDRYERYSPIIFHWNSPTICSHLKNSQKPPILPHSEAQDRCSMDPTNYTRVEMCCE